MTGALVDKASSPGLAPRPRVGFLGVGWIGRHRLEAIRDTGAVEVAAIADPSPEMAADAGRLAPEAQIVSTLEAILDLDVDGVVIASSCLGVHFEPAQLSAFCDAFRPLPRCSA